MPIGGSTARVAPLSPPLSSCASTPTTKSVVGSVFVFSDSRCASAPLSLANGEYVRRALSLVSLAPDAAPAPSLAHVASYLSHSIAASSVSLPRPSVTLSSLPRRPCLSPLIAPIYLLCVYAPLFFLSSLAPSALSHGTFSSRSRARGAAKFGRTHAATCLRHLVQFVGGEREEIPRRGSFLRRTVRRASSLSPFHTQDSHKHTHSALRCLRLSLRLDNKRVST